MKEIPVTKSFLVDGSVVDTIKVMPIGFIAYAEIMDRARDGLPKNPSKNELQKAIKREQIKAQAHFFAKGKRVMPDDPALFQMPAPIARSIMDAIDEIIGPQGKITVDGDGCEKPIIYQLGTALDAGGGKKVTELEFFAATYGQIEDVLVSADDPAGQTVALLSIAKPIEIDTLQTLPDRMQREITMADGIVIARDVLPRFLG